MKRLRALSLVFPILGLTATVASAQNRKEVIEKMTIQVDSLQKNLVRKDETIHQLEVKLAKLEGSQETNADIIKRLETKSDSLALKLISKTNSVDSLNSELKKLHSTIGDLKSSGDTLVAQNQFLQKELQTFKEKAPAKTPPLDNKPVEVAKPEVAVKKD